MGLNASKEALYSLVARRRFTDAARMYLQQELLLFGREMLLFLAGAILFTAGFAAYFSQQLPPSVQVVAAPFFIFWALGLGCTGMSARVAGVSLATVAS